MTKVLLSIAASGLLLGCNNYGSEPPNTAGESGDIAEPDLPTDAETAAAESATQDIVGVAAGAEDFKTLVAAIKAADLVETLQGDGPFTVFAPTDEAFAKLPDGTLDDLLKPENKDKLTAILTYHVVPGRLMAKDVVQASSAQTVQGNSVSIAVDGETVTVDKAQVLQTDIAATNGVIHVIDAVILPE